MCIRFAYRLFGFSWGAQLRLLLQAKQKSKHPITLWKHRNYQSPSWVPTAITVPAAGLFLPRRVSGVEVGVAQNKGELAGTAGSYLLAVKRWGSTGWGAQCWPLPPQLVFEGVQGSTSYLDIALDAISLHKGSCNQGEPCPTSPSHPGLTCTG